MTYRLIIDGNSVYEIDEECEKKKREGKKCDVTEYGTRIAPVQSQNPSDKI